MIKVDVRIISATNRPLADLVAQSKFREDLYYRLQGMPLHIPPLRERKEDIAKLAAHLLERILMVEKRARLSLTPGALDCLMSYGWPGNVRELYHILHRAVLLAESDRIEAGDLNRWFKSAAAKNREATGNAQTILLDAANGQPKTLEQIEQEVIDTTLMRQDFHIGKAAAILGIGQSTLYKRMHKDPELHRNA
jgi:transcriptional regulator with GAF, ATPase, and Fis domain